MAPASTRSTRNVQHTYLQWTEKCNGVNERWTGERKGSNHQTISLVHSLGRAARCTRSTCNVQHSHLQWTEKRNGVHGRLPGERKGSGVSSLTPHCRETRLCLSFLTHCSTTWQTPNDGQQSEVGRDTLGSNCVYPF